MASTNKTTNYELSQFIATDKPAWLGDYNQDMTKIDTQMKANATSASTNATAISGLQTSVSGISTDLGTAQSDITSLGTRVGTLETSVSTNTGDISDIKTKNTEQDGRLNGFDTTLTTLDGRITSCETNIGLNTGDITTLETTTSTQATQIQDILDTFTFDNFVDVSARTIIVPQSGLNVEDTTMHFAQSKNGKCFKVYGNIATSGSSATTKNLTMIPKGTSDTQLYGFDTGFVLRNVPTASYLITGVGVATVKSGNNFGYSSNARNIAVGADGHIYMYCGTGSTITFYANDTRNDTYIACTYFNNSFEDEPEPNA